MTPERAAVEECRSYQVGGICRDGFVQRPFCRGYGGYEPYCLRDELPPHMANDDGSPRFYGESHER
jgi:hypothetical protein